MLKTENLTLRPPSQDHYESLRNVKPCDEFYLMAGDDPNKSPFLDDKLFNESFLQILDKNNHWYVFKDKEIIGVTFLHKLEANDKRARYAVGIYNKENWNKGYGQEITNAILKYAFQSLQLHKVDLRVLDFNKRAIASYSKSGFVQEGRLRENAFINNEWHDDIVMSILCHEFSSEVVA